MSNNNQLFQIEELESRLEMQSLAAVPSGDGDCTCHCKCST